MTQKHESLMTNTVGQSLSDESILLKPSLHHFKILCVKPINSVSRFPRTSSHFKIGSFQSMAYATNQNITEKANNVQW